MRMSHQDKEQNIHTMSNGIKKEVGYKYTYDESILSKYRYLK